MITQIPNPNYISYTKHARINAVKSFIAYQQSNISEDDSHSDDEDSKFKRRNDRVTWQYFNDAFINTNHKPKKLSTIRPSAIQ